MIPRRKIRIRDITVKETLKQGCGVRVLKKRDTEKPEKGKR
jgi:hypothetical protein